MKYLKCLFSVVLIIINSLIRYLINLIVDILQQDFCISLESFESMIRLPANVAAFHRISPDNPHS